MATKTKLTKTLTEEEFNKGYWYANEIKAFAKEIGIVNSNKLRKDELEKLIKHYIRTGQVKNSDRKNIVKNGEKDLKIGLTNSLPIINYTSNKETKNFIITEADKLKPGLKIKSGVWYRLNRWRDEQITKGQKITYGDLVKQFIKLNQTDKFETIASTRFNNFISDFLENERGATRQTAMKEWEKLKTFDTEKTYHSWKQYTTK